MSWHRFRQRAKEYQRSDTVAIVVAPAALSLIGLFVGDVHGNPMLAVYLTIALVLLLSAYFIAVPRRRPRAASFARAGEEASADGVVLLLSPPKTSSASSWRKDAAQGLIVDGISPERIAAIGTSETGDAADFMRQVYGDRVLRISTLAMGDEFDARAASQAVTEAVRCLRDAGTSRIAVDVTGGTKLMSIGAYEAAAAEGVMAVYLSQDKPPRVLQVLEPTERQEE